MERLISRSAPAALAPSVMAVARDALLASVLLTVMAWLAVDVALLAAMAQWKIEMGLVT